MDAAANRWRMATFARGYRERRGSGIAAPLLWLIAFTLVLFPLALVIGQAVVPGLFDLAGPDFTLSFSAIREVVLSPHLVTGVMDTVLLGVIGAVLATVIGTALALMIDLTDVKGGRVWAVFPWVVFAIPSYFKGLAWVLLMLPGGYLVQLGLLAPDQARSFFGLPGLLLVMTFSLFPLPYFIVRARLQGMGSEMVDAARLAGHGPIQIVLRVVLPLLLPALGLALLTSFAEIAGDFGIATTIAREMNFGLITYNIYAATASYPVDFPAAGAQALVLVVLVAGSMVAAGSSGTDKSTRFVTGRNREFTRFALRRWQSAVRAALIVLFAGALFIPIAAVVFRAVTIRLGGGLVASNFSLIAIDKVLDPATTSGQALLWTGVYAFAAAVIAVSFGLLFAYDVALRSRLTRLVVSGLALMTVTLPGIILAFGFILVYDRLPGFRDLPLYGSRWLLVIGYTSAALPYCLIFVWSALDRLSTSMRDASLLAGISPALHLARVVVPLLRGSLAMAFGVTMVRSLFELPMSQFLLPLAGPPLPVVIADGFTTGRDADACALALVALLLVGAVSGAAAAITGRRAGQSAARRRDQPRGLLNPPWRARRHRG